MSKDTIGFNYFIDYCFPVSITNNLTDLVQKDATDYYKIIYIKTGSYHFRLNSKEYVISGSHAICLNEQDQIKFINKPEESITILWFKPTVINELFTFETLKNSNRSLPLTASQDTFLLKQFLPNAVISSKIIAIRLVDFSIIEQKLMQLQSLLEKQPTNGWPCKSRTYLYELLCCISRLDDEENDYYELIDNGSSSKLAIDVIYYMQSYYSNKITIEDLCSEFHTNRTTLLNDFKKYSGQSINHYLIQLRLTMASKLLRDTELSIDEICERTGFKDISYFSKSFKKGINLTPSNYRKLYQA